MPFLTVGTNGDDLTLQVPTKRTTDWANEFLDNFVKKIVDHDHSGAGRGKQLTTLAIADNSITGDKILLSDGTAIQWQDTNTGNPVDIISYTQADNELCIEPKLALNNSIVSKNNLIIDGLTNVGLPEADGYTIFYTAVLDDAVYQTGVLTINGNGQATNEFVGSDIINYRGFLSATSGADPTLFIEDILGGVSSVVTFKYIAIEL